MLSFLQVLGTKPRACAYTTNILPPELSPWPLFSGGILFALLLVLLKERGREKAFTLGGKGDMEDLRGVRGETHCTKIFLVKKERTLAKRMSSKPANSIT